MERYPTLDFLIRHGGAIAIAAILIGVGGGLWAAVTLGNLGLAVSCLLGGVVGYGLIRSYVELIILVTDMLVPK
jgi:hypothetical protein